MRMALLVLVVAGLVMLLIPQNSAVRADLDPALAQRPYPISFDDYVYLMLAAEFKTEGPNYSVAVSRSLINGRVRYRLLGTYRTTPLGQGWFTSVWPSIPRSIDTMCKVWTAQGYPISRNDFEFQAQAYP